MTYPNHAYLVCSTQRSGSTYLCRLLAGTGVVGDPQEYFEGRPETGLPPHPGYFLTGLPRTGVGVRDDRRPPDAPEYSDLKLVGGWSAHLERTFRSGTTPNGVFGAKLMWNQLTDIEQHARTLPELAGLAGLELLERLFRHPRYVWVRRRDKVRQAISLWRALQTRVWRVEQGGANDTAPMLQYNFDAIEHLRRRLTTYDEAWGHIFRIARIEPLILFYEDDVEPNPADAVARVVAHVGVELPPDWAPQARMVRQADSTSDGWREAYDRDAANLRS
jgi:trehalose 2-sulfotransferase